MKNKLSLLVILIVFPLQVALCQYQMSQNLISTAGGKVSSSGNVLFFSVGESVIGKNSNVSNVLAMGFWNVYQSDIISAVEEEETLPLEYKLEQNYPNPFNPTTRIKFAVPEKSNVLIKVYDILGNEIVTLVNEPRGPGKYEVEFSTESIGAASKLSSGVYIYRLVAGDFVATKKMMLIK